MIGLWHASCGNKWFRQIHAHKHGWRIEQNKASCAKKEDTEWVGTLIFGTGLVLVAITLVADSMEGGAALDTVAGRADPTAIRSLTEGYLLVFGSIGCILFALLSAASGYATLVTSVVPRWTGWLPYAVAILNLAAIPSIYGGTDPTGFYTAAGWGVAVIATFPWLIWSLIVSILLIRSREARAMTPAYGG